MQSLTKTVLIQFIGLMFNKPGEAGAVNIAATLGPNYLLAVMYAGKIWEYLTAQCTCIFCTFHCSPLGENLLYYDK